MIDRMRWAAGNVGQVIVTFPRRLVMARYGGYDALAQVCRLGGEPRTGQREERDRWQNQGDGSA